MTEIIILAAVLFSGIFALRFDSINLSGIFKKSPVKAQASQNEEVKMFFVSKRQQ